MNFCDEVGFGFGCSDGNRIGANCDSACKSSGSTCVECDNIESVKSRSFVCSGNEVGVLTVNNTCYLYVFGEECIAKTTDETCGFSFC